MTPRRILLAALALSLLLVGWLLARGEESSPVSATPAAPSPSREPAPLPALAQARAPVPEPAVAVAPPPPAEVVMRARPLIEDFTLEPSRACAGEEVLASVRLRPEAPHAKSVIHGRPGTRAVLSFEEPGEYTVRAAAQDWHDGHDERSATLTVEACPPRPRLVVTHRLVAPGTVRFEAHVLHVPQAPASALWDFADGSGERRAGLTVEHSYSLRPQTTPQSTFLVSVRAPGPGGRELKARAAVFLANESFVTRLAGHAFLPVLAERFPARRAGAFVSRVQVRSMFDSSAAFDTVRLKVLPCRASEPLREVTVPAASALDHRRLEAGALDSYQLELSDRLVGEGACQVEVRLEGLSGEEPFTAMFALSLDAPDTAVVIRDAALLARIARAQALLGREAVTAQEVEALALQEAREAQEAQATPPERGRMGR